MLQKWLAMLIGDSSEPASADRIAPRAPSDPVAGLIAQLGRREWLSRRTAARELGLLGQAAARAIPVLVEALVDPNADVRRAANDALFGIDPNWKSRADLADGIAVVVRGLAGDRAPEVSRAAGETLDRLGAAAGPGLARVVREEENLYLRILAVRALGKLGAAAAPAVNTLVGVLGAEQHPLREAAAEALGQIGPAASSAIEPLRGLGGDSFTRVSEAARRALERIEGNSLR